MGITFSIATSILLIAGIFILAAPSELHRPIFLVIIALPGLFGAGSYNLHSRSMRMSMLKKLSILSISLLVVTGISACEKKGAAEKAGEKIDKAVDKVEDAVNPKGPMEKAGEKIDETVDKTKDAVK